MKKYLPFLFVSGLYFAVALVTLFSWNSHGINGVTGDEPHYLVMTKGLLQGSLEQTQIYTDEFRDRAIFPDGLAPVGSLPSPENTHVVQGSRGLFNVHNLGLPLILMVPFLLGGILGAKVAMVFLGSLAVLFTWKISGVFTQNTRIRALATVVACLSSTLIPASNQIYSDVLAGTLALGGIYWFLTLNKSTSWRRDLLFAMSIAFLPWLQIKFFATAFIIVAAVILKGLIEARRWAKPLLTGCVFIASCVLLMAYNSYAFDNKFGPYQAGSLVLNPTAVMVFFGLLFDQNQGFFMQNPASWVGLLSIGALFARDRLTTLLFVLVFASLIVPNAMHPAWYGGWSFSGRFGWSAAIVFIFPIVYGLVQLSKKREKTFSVLIIVLVLWQAYLFYLYTFSGADLLNKGSSTLLGFYSIYYGFIHAWLPALYNVDWAYRYAPNYVWTVGAIALFALGFLHQEQRKKGVKIVLALGLIAVVGASFMVPKRRIELPISIKDLPGLTGHVQDNIRIATKDIEQANFLSYGPYMPLNSGQYEASVQIKSAAPTDTDAGRFEVVDATDGTIIASELLHGTASEVKTLTFTFKLSSWSSHRYEFRTYWNGGADFELHNIVLKTDSR